MVFRRDLGQIHCNLAENAFTTQQLAFRATDITFYNISTQACAEIKILRPTSFSFSIFGFFFHLCYFSFSFLFAAVIDLLLDLLVVKKASKKASSRQAIFTMGEPGVVAGNFGLSFFTQLFKHFCVYLRLHSADHTDLGIIGKIFSSCRS